jgi:hypothetical protein
MDSNTPEGSSNILNARFEMDAAAARFISFVPAMVVENTPKRRGAKTIQNRAFQRRAFSESAYLYKLCFDQYHAGGCKIKSMIFALDERKQRGKTIAQKYIYYSESLSLDELYNAVFDSTKI